MHVQYSSDSLQAKKTYDGAISEGCPGLPIRDLVPKPSICSAGLDAGWRGVCTGPGLRGLTGYTMVPGPL